MFKSIDKKFEEIGFQKVEESKFGAIYERFDKKFNYTQVLHLMHKASGFHLIQSYDKKFFDSEKKFGNEGVGLTMYEAKLCLKKMKKMGWKIKKEHKQ